jgi:hypothetical protein
MLEEDLKGSEGDERIRKRKGCHSERSKAIMHELLHIRCRDAGSFWVSNICRK